MGGGRRRVEFMASKSTKSKRKNTLRRLDLLAAKWRRMALCAAVDNVVMKSRMWNELAGELETVLARTRGKLK